MSGFGGRSSFGGGRGRGRGGRNSGRSNSQHQPSGQGQTEAPQYNLCRFFAQGTCSNPQCRL